MVVTIVIKQFDIVHFFEYFFISQNLSFLSCLRMDIDQNLK